MAGSICRDVCSPWRINKLFPKTHINTALPGCCGTQTQSIKPLTCSKISAALPQSLGSRIWSSFLHTNSRVECDTDPENILSYFLELLRRGNEQLGVSPPFPAICSSSPLFGWTLPTCCSPVFAPEAAETEEKPNICTEKLGSPNLYLSQIPLRCKGWNTEVSFQIGSIFPLTLDQEGENKMSFKVPSEVNHSMVLQ